MHGVQGLQSYLVRHLLVGVTVGQILCLLLVLLFIPGSSVVSAASWAPAFVGRSVCSNVNHFTALEDDDGVVIKYVGAFWVKPPSQQQLEEGEAVTCDLSCQMDLCCTTIKSIVCTDNLITVLSVRGCCSWSKDQMVTATLVEHLSLQGTIHAHLPSARQPTISASAASSTILLLVVPAPSTPPSSTSPTHVSFTRCQHAEPVCSGVQEGCTGYSTGKLPSGRSQSDTGDRYIHLQTAVTTEV